jgi:hypothetical protein
VFFTMHIFINAGEDNQRQGYTVLVCKGKLQKKKQFEMLAWNKDVPVWFQNNTWADRVAMIFFAKGFVEHKKKKHGDLRVLLICDNLKPHLNPEVKRIMSEATVFLFCLPPNITEALQPIDAAFGRSLDLAVGKLLDQWLMQEENLALWKGKMSAAQRRVLMSNLLAEAMGKCVKNDSMGLGWLLCEDRMSDQDDKH